MKVNDRYCSFYYEDACRAVTEEIQRSELTVLNNIYCHVVNTDEIIGALDKAFPERS